MKRKKWVKWNRRKVEEKIREKGRMKGKSMKFGKHNRRKRGTEKKGRTINGENSQKKEQERRL
jgi:hypothetical protein